MFTKYPVLVTAFLYKLSFHSTFISKLLINMVISKQAMSKLLLFSLSFAALIVIILPSLISLLLSIKPLIYLYLIINLLLVMFGVDSGLLKATMKPCDDSKLIVTKNVAELTKSSSSVNSSMEGATFPATADMIHHVIPVKLMSRNEVNSSPSLFFVGSDNEAKAESVADVNAELELFTRTEDFIEKFYKHLKMQREESRKKLQDLCLGGI